MRKKISLLCFIICLSISACIPSSEEISVQKNNADIQFFINLEIGINKNAHKALKKSVYKNGLLESKLIDSVNYSKELELFKEIDLNKSAWRNSFDLKEIEEGVNKIKIYTCRDPKVKIRKVEVFYENNEIQKIIAFLTTKNNLYTSFQKLSYTSHIGYEVISGMKIRWRDPEYFVVTGKFK